MIAVSKRMNAPDIARTSYLPLTSSSQDNADVKRSSSKSKMRQKPKRSKSPRKAKTSVSKDKTISSMTARSELAASSHSPVTDIQL